MAEESNHETSLPEPMDTTTSTTTSTAASLITTLPSTASGTKRKLRNESTVGILKERRRRRIYTCLETDCDFESNLARPYKQHIRDYHPSLLTTFSCEKCSYVGKTRKYLRRHVIRKHTEKSHLPYQCTECNCTFATSSLSYFKEHQNIHSPESSPHKCTLCSATFNFKAKLVEHVKFDHCEDDEDVLKKATLRPFKCSVCEWKGPNQSKLTLHEMDHQPREMYRFKCPQCDYATNRSDKTLKHHISNVHRSLIHESSSFIDCTKCDFTAKAQATYDRHVAKCTGERPYGCTKCDYKSAVLGNLYKHAETHVAG